MQQYRNLGIALFVFLIASFFVGDLNGYFFRILLYIGINITMAVSLNLINGFTGQFSLGHAGFMGVGAYTAAIVTTYVTSHHMNTGPLLLNSWFLVALIVGGLAAALVGLAVGLPSLRLKGDYLAIVTLGFNEIIRVVIQNVDFKIDGVDYVGGARGFGVAHLSTFYWVFLVAGITVFVVENLINSTYGRGFLSVRDDEVAAEAMGVNTTAFKVRAFVLGAFFAGVGGGLFAHFVYLVPDEFTFLKSIEIVVMVILGGMGSNLGVIIAAILLTILPEALREFADYRMIFYALSLIILMIVRPQGILGPETVRKLFGNKGKKPVSKPVIS